MIVDWPNIGMKFPPKPYQARVLEESVDKERWALLLKPGLGKTYISLSTITYWYRNGLIDAVLVVSRKGDILNWPLVEIPLHMPEDIRVYTSIIKSQMTGEERSRFNFAALNTEDALKMFFMAKSFIQFRGGLYIKELQRIYGERLAIIVDECSSFKGIKSGTHKSMLPFVDKAKYVRILTGTFTSGSVSGMWGQMRLLKQYPYNMTNRMFEKQYANTVTVRVEDKRRKQERIKTIYTDPKEGSLDKILELTKQDASILSKKGNLQLPEKNYVTVGVEMTKEQKKYYNDLIDSFGKVEIAGTPFEIQNALARASRLIQVAVGQIRLEDGTYKIIPNNRCEALYEMIGEEIGYEKKIIIWNEYVNTAKQVYDYLVSKDYKAEEIEYVQSSMKQEMRAEAIARFQHGDSKVFIANPKSMGYGITLTSCENAIYYTSGYSIETRLQSEDRIHRIGTTNECYYFTLVCPEAPIEQKIVSALREKKGLADIFYGEGYEKWFERI